MKLSPAISINKKYHSHKWCLASKSEWWLPKLRSNRCCHRHPNHSDCWGAGGMQEAAICHSLWMSKQDLAPDHWATCCEELTHWKKPWCWERLKAGREGDDRGRDGWMASLTQWTWVWANSRRWWRTGEAWHAAVHRVAKSRTQLSEWTTSLEARNPKCWQGWSFW